MWLMTLLKSKLMFNLYSVSLCVCVLAYDFVNFQICALYIIFHDTFWIITLIKNQFSHLLLLHSPCKIMLDTELSVSVKLYVTDDLSNIQINVLIYNYICDGKFLHWYVHLEVLLICYCKNLTKCCSDEE